MTLKGRNAIVTGSTSGIGLAMATALAKAGASVMINGLGSETEIAEATKEVAASGTRVLYDPANMLRHNQIAEMVERCERELGSVDILVNNAGIASRGNPVHMTNPAEVEKLMRVHAFGAFNLTHFALPHLLEQERGDIIHISSIGTMTMPANGSPYNMAKAAIEALSLTTAREYNKQGIFSNVISPGLTITDMGERVAKALAGVDSINELDGRAPFNHVCSADEVANAAVFLCSPANTYLTGQNIRFDAGETDHSFAH